MSASRVVQLALLPLAVVALSVCSDGGPDDGSDFTETPLSEVPEVSDPLDANVPGAALRLLAEDGQDVVYVALPVGGAPAGFKASVRRVGDEVFTTVKMQDGGFEPIAVHAGPSDSIEIIVRSLSGSEVLHSKNPVRPTRRPTVVRTWPPRKKTDMPVNALLVVVFSEPLDKTTVTSSNVRLYRGRQEVSGQVRVLDGDGTAIVFKPDASLAPAREYRLIVEPGVTDADGEPVESQVVLGFRTGVGTVGPPASVVMQHDSTYLIAGETHQLTARVFDANNNLLADAPVSWSGFEGISVSPTGLVTAIASPTDDYREGYVFASVPGLEQASAFIQVVPTPASVELVPSSATIGLGDTLALEAFVRSASGRRVFPPLTILNSGPTVASITPREFDWQLSGYRTVKALAPGVTSIVVRAGTVVDTAEITVTAARPVGAVRVAPAAAELMTGETLRLSATLRDANGANIQGVRTVSWTSTDESVARVDANGLVIAVANGTAAITATSEGKSHSASIIVTAQPQPPTFVHIDAADVRVCGITQSADTYCWGYGPHGPGSESEPPTSSRNRPVLVGGGVDLTQLAVADFTCGLTANGRAHCWSASWPFPRTPAALSAGITFTVIDGEYTHVCGVATSGAAYCWGPDTFGFGDPSQPTEYKQVAGQLMFDSITTGRGQNCGLTATGAAHCWGLNFNGQLGNGTTGEFVGTPVQVIGGHTFAQISAGRSHNCGITTSGDAYCWGSNEVGQVGDGTVTHRSAPVPVSGGLKFVAISAGYSHTCAIAVGGAAYCWGGAFGGALGIDGGDNCGFGTCKKEPVAVSGGLAFTRITAGSSFNCALTAAGRAYCWGANFNGNLGDGTNTDRSTPTAVARPSP